jgi:hypothetical protein
MKQIIKMALNGREHTVELNDSAMAKQFLELGAFDTSVSEYAGSHYWGPIPHKLSAQEELKTSKPTKGGVYYADHLTALAIYFEDPGSIAPYVVYHLGDVPEDMSHLHFAAGRVGLKIGQ